MLRILLICLFLPAAACCELENDPPSPPFVLDAGVTIDAPLDGASPNFDGASSIDAEEIATHPPFPSPQACVPVCLDAGAQP